jgi:hypothetical protein
MASLFKSGMVAAAALSALLLPQAASAQLFLNDPVFPKGPIQGSDPLVGLPVPGATAAEQRAHLIWNLRSGLNVAALQCQFSPLLNAADNYNGLLAHHSKELASAYTTLNNYFKRVQGAKAGQKAFDDYSTITYNNFSTLHAQLGFCQTAGSIAKEALSAPKGELHTVAERRMRELRGSLIPAYDRVGVFNPNVIRLRAVPPLNAQCWDKKNRLTKKCRAQYAASV